MRRIYILLSMLPIAVTAQNFTEVQTGMTNFYYSAADIADMNNDGTQDIVFNGAIDSDGDGNVDQTFNEVYVNNGGVLSPYAGLSAVTHLGDIKFIDYNNDGLMDIISTGLSYMDVVNYKQYRFRNTGSAFVKEEELPEKFTDLWRFLISIMMENRIMQSMGHNMLMAVASEILWIFIKILEQAST